MRVAITADAPSENSPVSPIFGRCAYYAIYDTATDKLEFVPNASAMYARGAGVQAAQQVANLGVQMVITAGIAGPNASMVLAQAGIQVINSFQGTVRDAVEAVKSGRVTTTNIPPAPFEPQYPPYYQVSKEEELRMLEEEKRYIEERLKEIKKRLEELKE
ncbi:hypothetical protein AciM339_0050 [Aciduliprofundum sp. MAR08-339]|uniref:NifB/NifX family molybdenum-iron cluster-binding protein n=1 Tax=Aciduliprofundum sp. (strain MAR08-339) TaxID=673860 RepID=UPI0002A4BECD|nr:hypothetical protein AciM339_0050 [Aciduliprofundum sp. MAR08-339]